MAIDRNAPCGCGSGRKYKRCCLAQAESSAHPPRSARNIANEELIVDILRFAKRDLGLESAEDLLREAPTEVVDDATAPFWFELLLFHGPTREGSIAGRYQQQRPPRRIIHPGHLECRLNGWASVIEVIETTPGEGILVDDVLVGERHQLRDISLSRSCKPRDSLLALLEEQDGVTYLSQVHPFVLPPFEAEELLKALRKDLHLTRTRHAKRADLQVFATMALLSVCWSLAVRAVQTRPEPTLQNTDGDPLLPTVDHFESRPEQHATVLQQLAAMDWAGDVSETDEGSVISVVRPGNAMHASWQNTVVGRIVVTPTGRVRVETNSIARADLIRARAESACGEMLRHHAREHSDMMSMVEAARRRGATPGPSSADRIPPEIEAAAIRAYKEKHFATWPDQPVPALEGLTPRQAAQAGGKARHQLDVLLKAVEHSEAKAPASQRYDVKRLRAELGLPG